MFEPEAVAARRAAYASAAPFPHVVIPGLCDEARARAVFAEAKTALRADYKVGAAPPIGRLVASKLEAPAGRHPRCC